MLQHKRTNSVQMSDGELVLIVPSKEMQEDAIGYKEEHFAYGDMQVHGTGGLAYYDDYDLRYRLKWRKNRSGRTRNNIL